MADCYSGSTHTQRPPRPTFLRKLQEHAPHFSQFMGLTYLLVTGAILLILTGLAVTCTVLGLTFFIPLIVIASPILIPVGTVIFLTTTGFLAIALLVVAALSWMYRYFRGRHPPGSDRFDYARSRIYDTASHVKEYAKEYAKDNNEGLFKLAVHHGGILLKDPVAYVGGMVKYVEKINVHKWSLQRLRVLMSDLHSTQRCAFFWHPHGENNVLQLKNNDMALCLANAALETKDKTACVYHVEHPGDVEGGDADWSAKFDGDEHDSRMKVGRGFKHDDSDGSDSNHSYHSTAQIESEVDDD